MVGLYTEKNNNLGAPSSTFTFNWYFFGELYGRTEINIKQSPPLFFHLLLFLFDILKHSHATHCHCKKPSGTQVNPPKMKMKDSI